MLSRQSTYEDRETQASTSGTTTSAYNAANMLLSTGGYGASGFQNDADGNTLSGNGRVSAWDSQNRLVSCIINGGTSTYKYGADGLRRQKTTNGTTTDYAYDSTMMVREGHATGGSLTPATVTATYLIGPQGPEYRRDDTPAGTETDSQGRTVTKVRWYVYDGLGSVVGEVDPLGNLTSSPRYDVYGAVRANAGTATSKQGFVGGLGHVSDTETGLIYMRARYYDPAMGRFASEDKQGSGVNWFIYCVDSPTNRVDRSGQIDADLAWDLMQAVAGITGVPLPFNLTDLLNMTNAQAAPMIRRGLALVYNSIYDNEKRAAEAEAGSLYEKIVGDDAASADLAEIAGANIAQGSVKLAAVQTFRLVLTIIENDSGGGP